MNKKTKEKVMRVVAMYLALNLLAEFIIPIPALALTGGPSQPEVESFEPVGTTEMVNLFTGDFNYNIPLMTVPGPNGGYPINLAYHAGIGMEQEASWTGLGWNINPGVINRNMRGLPDDFNGDQVTKTLYYKPQQTFGMDYTAIKISDLTGTITTSTAASETEEQSATNTEIFGLLNDPIFSYQIHYDNYRGMGLGISMNLTTKTSDILSSHFSGALKLSYDTDGGMGVLPSVSYNKVSEKVKGLYSTKTSTLGLGFHSRSGLLSLSFSNYKTQTAFTQCNRSEHSVGYSTDQGSNITGGTKSDKYYFDHVYMSTSPGPSVTFSSNSLIPNNNHKIGGLNLRMGVTIGEPQNQSTSFYKKRRFNLSYTRIESKEDGDGYPSYGTLYYQNYSPLENQNGLLDFNRDGNAPANKNASSIGVGYGTPDILFASGQGVSGAFKPFRSETGIFHDAAVINEVAGGQLDIEFGLDIEDYPQYEAGVDAGVNYSRSYSGDWNSLTTVLANILFYDYSNTDPLYEPSYYKSTGEMTASPLAELTSIGLGEALRFKLENIFDADLGILPGVIDELVPDQLESTFIQLNGINKRTARQKRSQYLSYRTSGQIDKTIGYGSPIASLYDVNEFPSAGTPTNVDYGIYPTHHIGEVTVTNPDGTRYVYGLPAYNTSQKEVMFTKDGFTENIFDKTKTYSAGQDNQVGNSEGQDHLYMSTEIPDYAYCYLVTAIYSADYVDLTDDGPSEDDFGYWVKFNYSKRKCDSQPTIDYGWRVPYEDANYSKGHISDLNDDKLNYMYGTKEVYYLNSVETKTHEAHFILNDNTVANDTRADGYGVPSENNLTSAAKSTQQRLNYLKSIELIGKADPSKVIKKVHFEYDYSLCGNVINNSGATVTVNSVNINQAKGKLTLKKVWFSHLGNEKGQLSPYVFSYDVGGTYDNPGYNLDHMDRWGNFMPDRTWGNYLLNSNENPYVNQNVYGNNSDGYASAWNLKKITLPSGGEINVTYESDDYAHVQDKPAMQMQRIVATGEYTDVDGNGGATSNGSSLNDRNLILFFDLEETFLGSLTPAQKLAKIEPYVREINDLYFKAFVKLKKNPDLSGDYSYDYVEGYAEVDWTATHAYGYGPTDGSGNITTGWVRVKAVERNPWNPIGQTDHPIKLAGWQYMRLERPDLFDDGNLFSQNATPNSIPQVIQGFINIFNEAQKLFGYFNFCQSRGYCNYINTTADGAEENITPRPSWLRLNSPDSKKLGGGHRVKAITITDNWGDMNGETFPIEATYGTSYEYAMPDGTSSGVAEYEPLIGGEENALRTPLRYQERKYPYRNDGLYTEQPFGEGLYPAANVGYSRVVVRSINNDDHTNDPVSNNVKINRTGITVTEFYTAKDFPVLNDYTDLQKKNFGIPVIIPFIGEISFNNKGYAQGFSLEFNNMHGQAKSQAVYPANADINNINTQPTSKAEYIYQIDPIAGPNGEPKLSNKVSVLDQDGIYRDADIGVTSEIFNDRQQHSNFSVNAGGRVNVGSSPPYVFWATATPHFEINMAMYRSISTMKIIQRNGVLSEVREYKDGAFTVNKSLMYDAETGQPLLTQTINNYNRPVYTYNYASHWAYDGMGPAYKNAGAFFDNIGITSGSFTYSGAANYFVAGDEVELEDGSLNRTIYWVSNVNATTNVVSLIKEDGTSAGTVSGDLRILRSGRRNQQISTNGVIVSLSNPVTGRKFPLFDAFNLYNASSITGNTASLTDFYADCVTGELLDVNLTWSPGSSTLGFMVTTGGQNCEGLLTFPSGHGIVDLQDAFDFTLQYHSNGTATATNGSTVFTCPWSAGDGCFQSCLDNVLHAEAYRFDDTWSFNYLDFGDPDYKVYGGSLTPMASTFGNSYRFGTAGIWRMEESWLYQVDRKQTTSSPSLTSTPGDGTYKHFVLHDWSPSSNHQAQNPRWSLANTVTMYDPHGYEAENKNALGIYSSALYGYSSSMPTAVASNTKHRELAYDGFEDYANPSTYTIDAPHGHCHFTSVNGSFPIQMDATYAHAGKYSLAVSSSGAAKMDFTSDVTTSTDLFNPVGGQQYHISVWVKTTYGNTPYLVVKNATTGNAIAPAASPDMSQDAIDGWRQINYDFVAPASTAMKIELSCTSISSGIAYFDDLRIQPFTSGVKTYVYNPLTLWLVAELDDRNYATFYNYDEEGRLVQVKKETENGVVTVNTSRSNTKR